MWNIFIFPTFKHDDKVLHGHCSSYTHFLWTWKRKSFCWLLGGFHQLVSGSPHLIIMIMIYMRKSKKVLYHKVDLFLIHSWQPSLPHCLRPSDPPWYQTQPQLLPKRWTSWTCMDHIGYWYWCIEYAYLVHFFGTKNICIARCRLLPMSWIYLTRCQ